MSANAIRTICIITFLVVFSFILGSYAVDGTKVPFMIFGAIAGLFVLNFLGSKCWVLIFLAPPFLNLLPLGALGQLGPGYLVGIAILAYWLFLFFMRKVRLAWNGYWPLDLVVILLFCYFASVFIRFPASVKALGLETDFVGGKEYITCVAATLFYFAMSILPLSFEGLRPVLKWSLLISFFMSLFFTGMLVSSSTDLAGRVSESRMGMFMGIGRETFLLLLSFSSPLAIFFTPWRLTIATMAAAGVMLSGYREQFGNLGILFLLVSFIKKQLVSVAVIGLFIYVGILYLSKSEILQVFPDGIQRALYILPGVDVERHIEVSADHSIDWREEMWVWAMDPRTGYIKDYIWGDGYALSVDYLRLMTIQQNRGLLAAGDHDFFSETGVWHNGRIHFIHRIGYVGLGIVILVMLVAAFTIIRCAMALRGHPLQPYVIYLTVPAVASFALIFLSAGTTSVFFASYYNLTLAKVLLSLAIKAGMVKPLFNKDIYQPIALRRVDEAPVMRPIL